MKKVNKIFDIESPFSIFIYSLFNVAVAVGLLFLYKSEKVPLVVFILTACIYLIILIVWIFFSFKPYNSSKSKSLTNFDLLLLIFAISFLMLGILSFPNFKIFSEEGYLPFTLFVGLFLACLLCFCVRLKTIVKEVEIKKLELCDVIKKKNLPKNLNELFIENTESKEDLLFRDGIVEKIHSCVAGYKGTEKQIIAITGKWGSGKTTLLNFALNKVKEDKNYIICDSFDPWSYNDCRSMLVGMFNNIYESLGVGLPTAKIKGLIERFANAFMVDQRISWAARLLSANSDLMSLIKLIDNYLLSNNKRLIVIIDNLDRISHEKFYFVYQLIAKLVDIKMTTFVCLYDEDLARKALELEKIDYLFLEKLTSRKIDVPNPKASNISKLGLDAFNSILEKYYPSIKIKSSQDVDTLTTIFESCNDLRELINLLNNFTMNFTLYKSKKVNIVDYLGICFIKYFNYSLFDKIYENAELFIRSDVTLSSHGLSFIDDSEKHKRIDDFVNKYLTGVNSKFLKIMDNLFPSFRDHFVSFGTLQLKEFDSESRICSGKHFDSYFSDNETAFTNLNMAVKNFLLKQNPLSKDLDKLFKAYSKQDQAFVIDAIQKMTEDDNKHVDLLLDYFILNYFEFSDQSGFFMLSARTKCAVLISKLLLKLPHDKALSILNNLDIRYIVLLSEIEYWLKAFKEKENIETSLLEDLNNLLNEKFNFIINNRINVYIKENYARRITWSLAKRNSSILKII